MAPRAGWVSLRTRSSEHAAQPEDGHGLPGQFECADAAVAAGRGAHLLDANDLAYVGPAQRVLRIAHGAAHQSLIAGHDGFLREDST
jgi:hypothetical protein